MYLGQLNNHEQTIFMQLAYIIVRSDQELSLQESNLLAGYESEMGRTFGGLATAPATLPDVLLQLSTLEEKTKKAIFYELLALALCDQNFDPKEQCIMNEVREVLSISILVQDQMVSTIKRLSAIYVEIGDLLGE